VALSFHQNTFWRQTSGLSLSLFDQPGGPPALEQTLVPQLKGPFSVSRVLRPEHASLRKQ